MTPDDDPAGPRPAGAGSDRAHARERREAARAVRARASIASAASVRLRREVRDLLAGRASRAAVRTGSREVGPTTATALPCPAEPPTARDERPRWTATTESRLGDLVERAGAARDYAALLAGQAARARRGSVVALDPARGRRTRVGARPGRTATTTST